MGPQLFTVRRVRPDVDRNIDAILTRVIRLVSRLKKSVVSRVRTRSAYVVTVLDSQLKTSALAVTLPHLPPVPNKYKSNTR